MNKPFKTLDEQIDILISRNLKIEYREHAKYLLMKNGYYSVINGYKEIFLKPKLNLSDDDVFEDNVTLTDIVELHYFDKKLRNDILSALGSVEDTLSTNLAYLLSEKFGYNEEDYINRNTFKLGKRTKKSGLYQGDILLSELRGICCRDEHPMKHYREKHKNVPPWILVKGTTFGTLAYMYKLLRQEEKNYIISRCLGIEEDDIDEKLKEFFSKMLDVFRRFRNWAAHGGRIYSHRVKEELPYYKPAYEPFEFGFSDYKKGKGKNDFFALIVALSFFLKSDQYAFLYFKVGVPLHLNSFKENNPNYYSKVLSEMGLPYNYYESIYKINNIHILSYLNNVEKDTENVTI